MKNLKFNFKSKTFTEPIKSIELLAYENKKFNFSERTILTKLEKKTKKIYQ